jgi:hypothetical protein
MLQITLASKLREKEEQTVKEKFYKAYNGSRSSCLILMYALTVRDVVLHIVIISLSSRNKKIPVKKAVEQRVYVITLHMEDPFLLLTGFLRFRLL